MLWALALPSLLGAFAHAISSVWSAALSTPLLDPHSHFLSPWGAPLPQNWVVVSLQQALPAHGASAITDHAFCKPSFHCLWVPFLCL